MPYPNTSYQPGQAYPQQPFASTSHQTYPTQPGGETVNND
jgi:hypothetical protein